MALGTDDKTRGPLTLDKAFREAEQRGFMSEELSLTSSPQHKPSQTVDSLRDREATSPSGQLGRESHVGTDAEDTGVHGHYIWLEIRLVRTISSLAPRRRQTDRLTQPVPSLIRAQLWLPVTQP